MDLLSHALYGVTVCSRIGLAGGRRGTPGGRRWYREPTVWWALLFGLTPDIISMWIPFAIHAVSETGVNFFHWFGGDWLTVYRATHSLVVATGVAGLLFVCRRSLFVPSLAWAIHVVVDAVSHGQGKFQNLPFYPVSQWGFNGVSWWRHPWVFFVCWGVLPATWVAIAIWRRGIRPKAQ